MYIIINFININNKIFKKNLKNQSKKLLNVFTIFDIKFKSLEI